MSIFRSSTFKVVQGIQVHVCVLCIVVASFSSRLPLKDRFVQSITAIVNLLVICKASLSFSVFGIHFLPVYQALDHSNMATRNMTIWQWFESSICKCVFTFTHNQTFRKAKNRLLHLQLFITKLQQLLTPFKFDIAGDIFLVLRLWCGRYFPVCISAGCNLSH